MQLSEKEAQYLKNVELTQATRQARQDSMRLLNDQGLAALSIALADFIADLMEHPEKLGEVAHR